MGAGEESEPLTRISSQKIETESKVRLINKLHFHGYNNCPEQEAGVKHYLFVDLICENMMLLLWENALTITTTYLFTQLTPFIWGSL